MPLELNLAKKGLPTKDGYQKRKDTEIWRTRECYSTLIDYIFNPLNVQG